MPEIRKEVETKLMMVLWFLSTVPIVLEATGDIPCCVSAAESLRSPLGRFVLDLKSPLSSWIPMRACLYWGTTAVCLNALAGALKCLDMTLR
jgi:hypothetical protein